MKEAAKTHLEAAKTHSEAAEAAAEEALTAAAEAELERDPLTWRIDSENNEEWEAALQTAMDYIALLEGVLTRTKQKAANSLIHAPEDCLDATLTNKQSYAPHFGEIVGILRQIKKTFGEKLSESQKEDISNRTSNIHKLLVDARMDIS